MAHIDEYLAPCAAFSFQIVVEFQTRVHTRRNKRESRNADWDQGRHSASAPFNNISNDGFLEIKRMFMACRARLHTFKLEDPADHEAENEIFGIGDGDTQQFQLRKVSTADSISYEREIYLPRAGVTFTANGAPVFPSYDPLTGVVDFGSPAPAAGVVLRWSGEFDLKVRFAQDQLGFTIDNRSNAQFRMNGSVDLVEVPE